jgi:hypothetical protein
MFMFLALFACSYTSSNLIHNDLLLVERTVYIELVNIEHQLGILHQLQAHLQCDDIFVENVRKTGQHRVALCETQPLLRCDILQRG